MDKPQASRLSFISKDYELISSGHTLKSLHSTVYRVDDLVLKIRSFDVKSAKDIKEYLKNLTKNFDFVPDLLGVLVGTIELDGEVKVAVVSVHSYAEPLSVPTLRDIWEILAIVFQAQSKGYTLDLKPSNFGKLRDRVVYVDEYGLGKPLPRDILEDFEKLKKKIEHYFKQVASAFSNQGLEATISNTDNF
ncbi:MAG: hypothetical protein QW701_01110 [Candidatus Nezhaarchaeales archaeon]